ncbi:MAG TPA: ATP-dependent DNA helicase [Candidatus Nanoarchaeia archaeon]|nr:ATP-dependent DNA helicase [Candidatus Nanoarchaeia archaeon]
MKLLFSHDTIRQGQDELVKTITEALSNKKSVLAHAPTGLGKTAAALAPALDCAIKNDLTIFFLTSRHTQHKIVLETVQKLKERNNLFFPVVSLIGKKHMCAQENVATMGSSDFTYFCKTLVEGNACDYYTNVRGKNTVLAQQLLQELKIGPPLSPEQVMVRAAEHKLCPYELTLLLAENAKVIIADYYYIFHPQIREALFGKLKKKLEKCIIVVDEGHNLPSRMRDLLTFRLSNKTMKLAIQESKKYSQDDVLSCLVEIQDILSNLSANVKEDKLVKQEQFNSAVGKIKDYDELLDELEAAAELVREDQRISHIGAVAHFLSEWKRPDKGFARVISKNNFDVSLSNRCLDPALLTKQVFDTCYAAIVMSATLEPLSMYADILGLSKAVLKSFISPFPQINRLSLIVPRTTTKYALRSERQYKEIAAICAEIAQCVPGCVMIFFPSYRVRDSVAQFFSENYTKNVFYERPGMEKSEKQKLLDTFSSHAKTGAVLLGVAAGSFGEGVDLPGVLKGVIVVGLPLDKPDLETTELIAYYDALFGKGWDYGYIMPAMSKCIQNAGRCIRTEKDRGVVVFLDERYAWPRYSGSFPKDWNARITLDYNEEIARFFGKLF